MFNKRKKARELEAQLKESQLKEQQLEEYLLQSFDKWIKKASEIKDPAVKLIELNKIDKTIDARIHDLEESIDNEAERKSEKIKTVGSVISTAGVPVAISLLVSPLAWVSPIVLVGMIAGETGMEFVAGKRKKTLKKQFEAASKDYLQNLKNLSGLVSEITKVTVESNVQELSKSPLYKNVLELPGLTEIYAVAAAKHIRTDKELTSGQTPFADKAQPPAEEKKTPPPPRKRPPPNYDDLKGL